MKKLFRSWDALTVKFLASAIIVSGLTIVFGILYYLFDYVKSII